MMETRDIQKLLDFIAHSGLDEVLIETSDLKISVKRYSQTITAAPTPVVTPVFPSAAALEAPPSQPPLVAKANPSNYVTIKSPMIGTFYRSSGPDVGPFVDTGDEVKPGTVVCIIEAMKLFNEIESEVSGRIVEVLVENATPVEYDQPLFLVEPF